MRMAIGQISHETNTFIPREIGLDIFEQHDLLRGDAVIERHGGIRTYLGGMIDTARRLGHEVVATISAIGGADAPIAQHTYETLRDELVDRPRTDFQSVKTINEACWRQEAKPGVLDCTFFHGFGWTDLPRSGVSIYVATDNDPTLARTVAEEVAQFVWDRRDDFVLEPVPPAEAIKRALAVDGRPVVINDGADDPGGGAPSDGTHLLRAMIEADLDDACFGFIVDPVTANQAHEAGVGATIAVKLGGRSDELHGAPIETDAYVKCITDGTFVHTAPGAPGMPADYGRCARLQIGGIDVIVTSYRTRTLDPEIFVLHGVDVMRTKIIALKSSDHFRGAFIPISAAIIRTDAPGIVSTDLPSLPYQRLERPIWPLDRDLVWTAQ